MKRFIRNILFFIIPFIIGIIYIFQAPYSKEYGYGYRKNVDCNTSWIYYRLFQNPTPIDIAFMGTSHTGCGINDSLIERLLTNKYNSSTKVANLAYCTIGRNIQLPLVRDLLKTKKPKLIVMEVTEEESKSSHKDFGYIGDVNDLFQPEERYNSSAIEDAYSAFFSRFNYTRKKATNSLILNPPATANNDYSYVPFNFTADKDFLQKHKKKQINRFTKKRVDPLNNYQLNYPKSYIKKIADLAKENNIKIIFLYLPSYGSTIKVPLEYDYYKQFGEVLIPSKMVFNNPNHWVDGEHLNYKGSTELAKWLSKELVVN